MLFLNIRQIELIHRILKYEYIQSDEIVSYFMISSRTLQSDISLINYEFEKNGYELSISLHRRKGYFVESLSKDTQAIEQLKNQCIDYLDNSILRELGSQPRVCFIIRKLLEEKSYLKSEDLIDELHISNATLTNDLKLTRNVLDRYKIDINSVPYYGMQISGDSLKIRSCMLDFCDIYNDQNVDSIFPEYAYEQYHFSKNDLLNTRSKLIKTLQNSGVLMTDRGFKALLMNILLIQSNTMNTLNFRFNESGLYQSVSAITQKVCRVFNISSPSEMDFIEFLILLNLDDISIQSNEYKLNDNQTVLSGFNHLRDEIHKQTTLDLSLYSELSDVLKLFILKSILRKRYQVTEKSYSSRLKNIVRQIPASRSLAINILRVLYPTDEIDLYLFLDLSIILFNSIFTIPNNYADMRIAYVNKISRFSNRSVSYRNSLTRYNIDIDYLSSYDLETIDYAKYDGIITSGVTQIDRASCPVVVLDFDYFDINRNSTELWEKLIMKLRLDELIQPKLSRINKRVMRVSSDNLIDEIVKYLSNAGFNQPNLSGQIRDGLLTSQSLNSHLSQMFILYHSVELKDTIYQFILEEEITMNGSLVGEISIIILNPDMNILSIKQADSAIRRLYQQTLLNRP